MEGSQRCSVQVTIRGKTVSIKFRLRHDTSVVSVLDSMRATCGVVDGMLSYDNSDWEMVNELEAGRVYFFVGFSAPQGTQAYIYLLCDRPSIWLISH
jgi:hypothetical protein